MGIPHESIGRIPNMADAIPSLWNDTYQKIDRNFANLDGRMQNKETGGLPAAAIVASETDLNGYTESTLLYLSTAGTYNNMPAGCTGGFLLVLKGSSGGSPAQQLLFADNQSCLYMRKKVGETWSAWEKINNDQVSAGVEAGQIGGAALRGDELDLNRFNAAGFYYLLYDKDNYVNCPTGFTGGFLQVLKGASPAAPVIQICYSQTAKTIYTRRGSGAAGSETWGEWIKTADSDMLAYAASHGQIGARALVSGKLNLNTYNEPGSYYLLLSEGYLNAPTGFTGGFLDVYKGGSPTAPVLQICYRQTGEQMFMRYGSGAAGSETWGEWVKSADAAATANVEIARARNQIGDVDPETAASPDLNDYVETGNYLFPSAKVSKNKNFPVDNLFLWVFVRSVSHRQSPTKQIAVVAGTNAVYQRHYAGSAWSQWKELNPNMTGATAGSAGSGGMVPAPAAGKQDSYLLGSGAWGKDADVTAAKTAGQIGGAALRGDELDLNRFNAAGFYYLLYDKDNYVNCPTGFTGGFLQVLKGASPAAPVIQICYSQTAKTIYTRRGSGAAGSETWGEWIKTADSDILETAVGCGQIGNAVYVAEDGDLDNYTASAGTYYLGASLSLSHAPDGVTCGFLTIDRVSASGPVVQRFTQSVTKSYIRVKNGGTWSEWRKEIVDTDAVTGATASAAGRAGLVPAPAVADIGKYLMADGAWGKDADVTAAKAAGQIGDITQQAGAAVDLNDYKATGNYLFSSAQSAAGNNFPATNLVTWLAVLSTGGSPTKQIALIAGTNAMYHRYYAGSTWGPWVRIGVPFPQSGSGIGEWKVLQGGEWDEATGTLLSTAPCVLPAGGSWAYHVNAFLSDGRYKTRYSGVAAGGTTVAQAFTGRITVGFCWRIA